MRLGAKMNSASVDYVALYGVSKGWRLLPRSVLVEGTSDVALFELAATLYKQETGKDLIADLAIVAAGERDRGGTKGVVRELLGLRAIASTYLAPSGRSVYRFMGLFDNDTPGQNAVNAAQGMDTSILEYRDVFRLRPIMPILGNLDPGTAQRGFEKANEAYKNLRWEVEDLIGEALIQLFLDENPTALVREDRMANACHRELTRDGKARLVRFCSENADLASMEGLVNTLHALRCYMVLPNLQ